MNIQSDEKAQELILKNRKELTLTGVESVKDFAETQLVVNTVRGVIYIEGEEMKIDNLSKDDGVISVSGNITGFYYKESRVDKGRFSKLFR